MSTYERYEGKKINVVEDRGGLNVIFDAVVTGYVYDIGLTIQALEGQEDKLWECYEDIDPRLVCVPGPSTQQFKEGGFTEREYEDTLKVIIPQIEVGCYFVSSGSSVNPERPFSGGDMVECSFT